ncbi:sporulation protein YunB [Candidatus Soleaferrea massiliensis]|uniref:sporulation protein YunB n=1 Tax=Candidatus Soleaferrea massiliensis TaxID=1470354 RepID=UPI0005908E41|nr:sporulation protein YunB [Candidatus Soleaferrea massiliensis]
MRRRVQPKKRARAKVLIKIGIVLLVLMVLLMLLDAKIRPIIISLESYQARVHATKVINSSITEELERQNIQYDDLVHITRDTDGNVTALETDSILINKLQASLSTAIMDGLTDIEDGELKIALGTLLDSSFLVGRGPMIDIKFIPIGYIDTQITHNFESAGINQTRDQVMLHIKTTAMALIPGYSANVEISTDFCLAETVIVGKIPEAYTRVERADDPERELNDYGASRYLE